MTKLKLFHVVERKMYHANFRDKLPFVNSMKGLIFNSTKIPLPKKFSSYIQFDCEDYALSDTFYKIEIELLVLVLGQKPPGQNPPGQKPPLPKTPRTKTPRQNILFRNFITFVFRMIYGKEISIWFLAVKYIRHGSIK